MAKSYFTMKELTEFKEMLEQKRDETLKSIRAFEEEVKEGDYDRFQGDDIDRAGGEIEGTLQAKLQDKHRKLLSEINNALAKFEDGSYGICEGTEEYISKERLRIRPWTRYSIEYKEIVDKQKKLVQRT